VLVDKLQDRLSKLLDRGGSSVQVLTDGLDEVGPSTQRKLLREHCECAADEVAHLLHLVAAICFLQAAAHDFFHSALVLSLVRLRVCINISVFNVEHFLVKLSIKWRPLDLTFALLLATGGSILSLDDSLSSARKEAVQNR